MRWSVLIAHVQEDDVQEMAETGPGVEKSSQDGLNI